jgi:HD-like signal output (HDOD) protein
MQEVLLQKIKQLPPLPESALQIEAVYQDPNSSFDDMVKILEKDPLLTADILKAANSPLYGFTREINSIAQAVGLFGMGTVRGFALASIVKKSFPLNLSPYGISNDQFSTLSKQQHALVTNWYLRKDPKLLGILSPAAFLVEIGKALISQYLAGEQKENEFKSKIQELGNIEAAEHEVCGTDTAEVSATIFTHWQFEPALVDAIRYSSAPENATENPLTAQIMHVVRTAVTANGTISEESATQAKELVGKYELDLESFENALAKLSE